VTPLNRFGQLFANRLELLNFNGAAAVIPDGKKTLDEMHLGPRHGAEGDGITRGLDWRDAVLPDMPGVA
jgi:hypothetical protein